MIYEILYIIPARYSDSEIEGIQTSVQGLYTKSEAEVKEERNLGKIKFAYPIKKERFGTYILSYVEADAQRMQKIDLDLRLADQVLRHIIVKCEDGIPKAPFTIGSYIPPITPEGKRASQSASIDAPRSSVKREMPAEPELSEEEIDKKLDEILENDIVDEV